MRLTVIGAGKIGGTLAQTWGAAGHQITLGVRDPGARPVQDLVQAIGPTTRALALADAVVGADVLLFAVPGSAMDQTLAAVAPALAAFAAPVVIDATNDLERARGGGAMNSVAAIAAVAPRAAIYRAFNSLGWENFAEPRFAGVAADLFYAGPAGATQTVVEQLIREVGLRPMRLGGTEAIALVDSVLPLWFALAAEQQLGRHLAFKVLTD